jgi:hypothetical protein
MSSSKKSINLKVKGWVLERNPAIAVAISTAVEQVEIDSDVNTR